MEAGKEGSQEYLLAFYIDFKEPKKTVPDFKISIIIPFICSTNNSAFRIIVYLPFSPSSIFIIPTSLFPAEGVQNKKARRASTFSQLHSFLASQLPSFLHPLSNRASIPSHLPPALSLRLYSRRNPLSIRASIPSKGEDDCRYHCICRNPLSIRASIPRIQIIKEVLHSLVAIPYQSGHQFRGYSEQKLFKGRVKSQSLIKQGINSESIQNCISKR